MAASWQKRATVGSILNLVFLELPNVRFRTVFVNPVTYVYRFAYVHSQAIIYVGSDVCVIIATYIMKSTFLNQVHAMQVTACLVSFMQEVDVCASI